MTTVVRSRNRGRHDHRTQVRGRRKERRPRILCVMAAPAVLAVFMTGCTVGPDFHRPAPPEATTYTTADEAASSPAPGPAESGLDGQRVAFGGAPQAAWWQLFGSADLDAVVRRAVAGNPGIESAQATLAQAGDVAAAVSGNKYPQVDLGAGAGRQKYGAQFLGSFKLPPFTSFGIGPTVRYVLDYDGGAKRADEQYAALAQFQRHQLDATYLALTGNVVLQAINLAAAREQIRTVEQIIADDNDTLRLVRTAFDEGSVPRMDVVSARSQLAADETLLPPLRQAVDQARHQLAVLVGSVPSAWAPPEFDLAGLTLPAQVPASLPSDLVRRRPDILSAEAQLHAATAAVGVATADLYPKIQLTAGISQQATRFGGLFDGAGTAWSALAALTEPVFDGGIRRAEKRAAVDVMHARAADYRQTVLAAFGQVADLLDALQHDGQLVITQANAVGAARENLALARESYEAGNSGVLQVLDAQRQQQQAQMGLLRARARQYLDTAQLLLAMGGAYPGG